MPRKRLIFTLILAVVTLIGLAVGWLTFVSRNATLQLGSGRADTAALAEATPDTAAGIPFAPPPATLAFSSNRTGSWDVYRLDPDGTLQNLTDDGSGAHHYFPSFALDGGMINFISSRGSNELVPTQVKPDGTGLRTLSIVQAVLMMVGEGRFDWDPVWSPRGDKLLWSSLRDFNLELYVIPLADTLDLANATRLTRNGARDWFGAWSPDSARVAFASDRSGNEDIYVMNADGSDLTRLTDSPHDDLRAMWELDGTRLLYVHDADDSALLAGRVVLWGVDLAQDAPKPAPFDGTFAGAAVWSPDGQHVAYVSNAEGNWHVYVMNADGSNVRRVTDGNSDHLFPVWMP